MVKEIETFSFFPHSRKIAHSAAAGYGQYPEPISCLGELWSPSSNASGDSPCSEAESHPVDFIGFCICTLAANISVDFSLMFPTSSS